MQKLQNITFTGKTDVGLKRDHNEDSFVSTMLWDSSILLCCIDGVGGMAGGAVCSATVAEKMVHYLKDMQSDGNLSRLLKRTLVKVNNDIIALQKEMPQCSEMACVVTSILADTKTSKIYMAHVGDTRLYEFVDGKLVKLSHDHSPVGVREEMGILTEEEAMAHPKRNIIERCIGDFELDEEADYIETAEYPFKVGATYLLCSDGLTDMVTSSEISQILNNNMGLDEKTDKLIAVANEAGGKDNITVLLLEIPDERTDEERLVDSLVNNSTIELSEERLIPNNEQKTEDEFSSHLFVEIREKGQEEIDEEKKNAIEEKIIPQIDDVRPVEKYTEDVLRYKKRTSLSESYEMHNERNLRNLFFYVIVFLVVNVIVWMWYDVDNTKQNQQRILADTVEVKADEETTGNQYSNDTICMDSMKFILNGDTIGQNQIHDSLDLVVLILNN